MLLRIERSILLCLLLCLSGSVYETQALSMLSIEQENKLGEETYREILKKEKICTDPEINAFVKRVTDRITAAAPDKGFKYEITVLESPNINAFCLPGGKMCVYTGILPYCENEAGLATVMGHEVAHAILRHGGQRMTQGTVVNVLGKGLNEALRLGEVSDLTAKATMAAYGYGSQLGILLPYSRSHETEADREGLMYMAKAGYDPAEAPEFWKRFSAVGSDVPTFFSTHPSSAGRSKALMDLQPGARAQYDKSPKYGRGAAIPAKYRTIPDPNKKSDPKTAETKNTAQSEGVKVPTVPANEPKSASTQKTQSTQKQPSLLEQLTSTEVASGLKTALSKGVKSAITALGKEDGYFKDAVVKIVVPERLQKAESMARTLGRGRQVDEFVLQMNRAAEKAVPETAAIFADALASMTLDDAKALLSGKEDAATQFFKRTSTDKLQDRILPLVKTATASTGATKAFKEWKDKLGFMGGALLGNFDVDSYVTEHAIAGLFVKMADEEKKIRSNPGAFGDSLLEKVFGAVKK